MESEVRRLVDQLRSIVEAAPASQDLNALHSDLANQYLPNYRKLPTVCKHGWEESASRRLRDLLQRHQGNRKVAELAGAWRAMATPVSLHIKFGQMRVAPNFQGSASTTQGTLADFPEAQVVGRPLVVVGGTLRDGAIAANQLPVQVFWSAIHNTWVALNNRGLAVHCLAGVRPLRIWPRVPDQKEINRLSEIIDFGSVSYASGFHGIRRATGERQLPSSEMIVSVSDKLPLDIQQIITVPATW